MHFRTLAMSIVLLLSATLAVGQSGYTTVSGACVGGCSSAVQSATIYFQPMAGPSGLLGAAQIGSTSGGQITEAPTQAAVVAGAFTMTLADAVKTTPSICYAVTVIDNVTGNTILGAGLDTLGHVKAGGPYGCVQPTGTTWDFDTYIPSLATVPTTGLGIGSVTMLSPGSTPTAAIGGSGPYVLSLGIPQGATGATGPQGPAGASGVTKVIDVTQYPYNANSTCTADATTAINTAVAAADAMTQGAEVYLPAGCYSVTSINAAHSAPVFQHTVTLAGAGKYATIIMGSQAGANVLDMLGTNDWEVRDLTISSGLASPQTGILLARSTTSQNAAFNYFTDVMVTGSFSVCGVVSIAAEDDIWTRPYFHNTNGATNYCGFETSSQNDFGVTDPNGTIFASTNTSVQMIAPIFNEPYPGAIPVRFSTQADYTIYGALVQNTNTTGGHLVEYDAPSGYFTGPVSWIDSHFEGNVTDVHYLKGEAGHYNYYTGIRQTGGMVVVGGNRQTFLLDGNDGGSTYNWAWGAVLQPAYFSASAPSEMAVSLSYFSGSKIDLCTEGYNTPTDSLIQVLGFTFNSTLCADTVASTYAYANPRPLTSATAPTGGVFPKGTIVTNSSPTGTGPAFWQATTGGYVAKGAWAAATAYSLGDYVTNGGLLYKAIVAGTSGSTGPSQIAGLASDGGVTWVYVAPTSIGAAVFSQALTVPTTVTGAAVTAGTATAGQAACIKSAGPPVVLGYCSTVPGSGGACTCN
jgi:Pectate lyase superfamily protein